MDKQTILNAVDELQQACMHALDRRDMNAWLGCYAEDGTYLCQSKENFDQDLPIGFMWDDRYGRLKDRVKAITEVWAGTAEEYQSRHLTQRLVCREAAGGLYEVISNFVVFYTTNNGDSRVLATGEYLDQVRITDGRAQFVSRKAILDQVAVPRYLVYPI
jgi:3-phenylpropionate/cinnamic acid dioxygenase small subunit